MKRVMALAAVALAAGLVLFVLAATGMAQQPGGQSISLNPFAPPPSQSNNPFLPATGAHNSSPAQPVSTGPSPNADIQIKPTDGEWVISVMVYKGPEANQYARQFVSVLRGSDYKLWAFTHDNTAEARKQQEMLRQEAIERKKLEYLSVGQKVPDSFKVRLPHIEVQDEVAVFVGGYKDQEAARCALAEVKKLPMPDETKVKMDRYFATDLKDGQRQGFKESPLNPFPGAWLVRNPTLPKQTNTEPVWDMTMLHVLNDDETYSLLTCHKKVTLVVKEFRMPVTIVSADMPRDGVGKNLFNSNTTAQTDYAMRNAHELAEVLRANKLEAYVFHDRKYSLVTVGGFDGPDDPKIRDTQKHISTLQQYYAQKSQVQSFDPLQLYPVAIPMKIPH